MILIFGAIKLSIDTDFLSLRAGLNPKGASCKMPVCHSWFLGGVCGSCKYKLPVWARDSPIHQ